MDNRAVFDTRWKVGVLREINPHRSRRNERDGLVIGVSYGGTAVLATVEGFGMHMLYSIAVV